MAVVAPSNRLATPRNPLRRFFVGPMGYLLLAGVVTLLLILGSGDKAATPEASRIAHLEGVIRCPSCADLSIANSETTSARGLRAEVSQLVHQGLSDGQIEARIEAQFPGTLLIPSGGSGVVVFLLPAVVIVAGAITFATLLFRRTTRHLPDDAEGEQLVEAARRQRAEAR